MATTSFLYHSLGLRGYRHLATHTEGDPLIHHVEMADGKRRCRGCGAHASELVLDGRFQRTFRALPIGSRRQFVVLHGHEQVCGRCGSKLREPIPFADGSRRYLRCFERYIVDLCRIAPIKHVARFLGVSWTFVKDVFKRHLHRRLKKRSLKHVRYIAIAEFSIRKGHQYMTVILDLESGTILHAAEGRGAEADIPFMRRLKAAGAQIQAVAMEMWPAHSFGVREVFDSVPIVYDPYHIVAMANAAIDATRRDMYRDLTGKDRVVLK